MKSLFTVITFVVTSIVFSSSCNSSNGVGDNFQLNAQEFSEKITSTPDAVILDVRTPGEFSQGHIQNAINISWNDPTFDGKINNIAKNAPIFIYC
jgi:predicted sulfurtransferase